MAGIRSAALLPSRAFEDLQLTRSGVKRKSDSSGSRSGRSRRSHVSILAEERARQRLVSFSTNSSTPRWRKSESCTVAEEAQLANDAVSVADSRALAFAPLPELLEKLGTDMDRGLDQEEADAVLAAHGPNELVVAQKPSIVKAVLHQLKSAIVLLMLAIAAMKFGISLLMQERSLQASLRGECAVYLILVCVILVISTITDYSSAEGVSGLNQLGSPEASVIRDGLPRQIPKREVVPGDVVELLPGRTVPADARVLTSQDLTCEQSVITGESADVRKVPEMLDATAPFPSNMVYASTAVTSGKGRALVISTGRDTVVGRIGENLRVSENLIFEQLSPLEAQLADFVTICGWICGAALCAIAMAAFSTGYQDPLQACPFDDGACFEMATFVLACSVGVVMIPNGIPFFVNCIVAAAMIKIRKCNVMVRRGCAIDTLGCATVICTDKTGTLTAGRMTVAKVLSPVMGIGKQLHELEFGFRPLAGVDPRGHMSPCGSSIGVEPMQLSQVRGVMAACASLSSQDVRLIPPQEAGGRWDATGNMTEVALHVAALKAGAGAGLSCKHAELEHVSVPFSSSRKMSASVRSLPTHASRPAFEELVLPKDTAAIAIVKGAPDQLIRHVSSVLTWQADGALAIEPLQSGGAFSQEVLASSEKLAASALRVVFVGVAPLREADLSSMQSAPDADARLGKILAAPLCVVALFGILDPPRAEVQPAIDLCHAAGIRVVMITGDQTLTAEAVGSSIGLSSPLKARECSELRSGHSGMVLAVSEVDALTLGTNIWARAQPSDKMLIVRSLQAQGQVCAMTGDGVNDAPALRVADVGVAMGISGTETAQGCASAVLLDDNFGSIVKGISLGRGVFANIQRYVFFFLSIHTSELLCFTMCLLQGLPFPVSTAQLTVLTGFSAGILPMSLIMEPAVPGHMLRRPRAPGSGLLNARELATAILPWCVFFALMWIAAFTTTLRANTGFTTSAALYGTAIPHDFKHHACEFAGRATEEAGFIVDHSPFHCRCYKQESLFSGTFHLVDDLREPWAPVLCKPHEGAAERWCWTNIDVGYPALLAPEERCSLQGLLIARNVGFFVGTLGQTFRFVTLLRTVNSRSGLAFQRNPWMWALVACNCVVALVVSSSASLAHALNLETLDSEHIVFAISAVALSVIVTELCKVVFQANESEPSTEEVAEEARLLSKLAEH